MTIHWKALVEHFLMVPLVFPDSFSGENAFSQKTSSPGNMGVSSAWLYHVEDKSLRHKSPSNNSSFRVNPD
jgi:hypothetical protein